MKKKNEGITLIALVITIIVLLILAGVSISLLSGENGVLKRAGDAKKRTEISSLQENVQLALSSRETEKIVDGANSKNLKDDLEEKISDARVEWANGLNDVCYVIKGENYVTVYDDGTINGEKINIWGGITEENINIESPEFKKENNVWNWYIYSADQLKFLADFVNNGNSLTGSVRDLTSYVKANESDVTITEDTVIYLMNDIDLGAREGEGTTDEEKWGTNPEKLRWTPIGISGNELSGTFEGNNHTIRGAYVNTNQNGCGFFGNSRAIKNLTIKNSFIKGGRAIGGIVGSITSGELYNCNNENTIVISTGFAGGIVGYCGLADAKIENCKNTGKIRVTSTSDSTNVGGIVGSANCEIKNCENKGKIIGNKFGTGGIVGTTGDSATIIGCFNNGNIDGNIYTGGIAGNYSGKKISNCINNSTVSGNTAIGGIVGNDNNSNSEIINCTNNGTINGKTQLIGGIIGYCKSDLINCNNTGNVTGEELQIGGIVGYTTKKITGCINSGNITKEFSQDYTGDVGGIVGITDGTEISDCINNGFINATNARNVGGIAGASSTISAFQIKRCVNKGKVNADNTEMSGGSHSGIIGLIYNNENCSIQDCYNIADVTGTWGVGSIIGVANNAKGNIKNCYNIGKIKGEQWFGGLAGDNMNSSIDINNCYYLIGTAQADIGKQGGNIYAKDKEFLTTTFVTNANNDGDNWTVKENENNGFPVLK